MQLINNLFIYFKKTWRQNIIYIGFVLVFLFFALTLYDSGFLSINNILNITRQTAIIAIMAVAMTLVLSSGEIDLSVGSIAGLASVTTALGIKYYGIPFGISAGLATGVIVGILNGLISTRLMVPTFLTTLAMMGIAKGVSMWISGTRSISIIEDPYTNFFGSGDLFGVPSLLIWMIIIGFVGHILYRHTKFGRQILAVGGNVVSANYSGINTNKIKFFVLIISSLMASLAGMLYAGRLHTGRFQLGEGDELSVIAAAVLGGTSLFGGKGTVIGSIIGALMIGVINNGLILMGLEYPQQLIARGAIIIFAVAISESGKNKA
jgi:ribose transport system permease protein|tara:strand:+ start:613 stop:1575 length:963 start_codon:yes stop_codon:yes gene_type:complete